MVTIVMNHWRPVYLSLTARIGMIVVPRLGLNVTRRSTQISRIEMMQTGSAMKNQVPQFTAGCMCCSAMIFWGDAIGDAAPPMLEANAMPRISAFEKRESVGRFRSIGFLCLSAGGWCKSQTRYTNLDNRIAENRG